MAHVLTFDEVSGMVGNKVYEEWICGTGAFECTVVSRPSENSVVLNRSADGASYWAKRGEEYRYWDALPTDEERQFTAW